MRKLLTLASTALLAGTGLGTAHAATIIQTIYFGAGDDAYFGVGNVSLGPGHYVFRIDTTSPFLYLDGYVQKTISYDFTCQFGPCGGDDADQQSFFSPISPTAYVASVTVNAPYSVIQVPPYDPTDVVRIDYHDICCRYDVTIQAGGSGHATLSYSAVPEPQGWALLVIGFGTVGAALRKRQRITPTYA